MKKALKFSIAFLILVAFFVSGLNYYFFIYPRNLASDAASSIKIGRTITSLMDDKSQFIEQIAKNKVPTILNFIYSNKKLNVLGSEKSCATLTISKTQTVLLTVGNKFDDLDKISDISKHPKIKKDTLSKCNILSATFLPALFYRCTVKIKYDQGLVITAIGKPICWD